MKINLITRENAVDKLYDLINSGILDEKLCDDLEEIAYCINHENDNLFLWGAEQDCIDLFVSRREDLIDDEWLKHQKALYEKYKIREVKQEQ